MSGESSYFKLGLFVIIGVAFLVAGVVIFGGAALFTHYITVETATTGSVEGLGVGAAVKYSGVSVGKVSKIEMANWKHRSPDPAKQAEISRYVIVEMKIRPEVLIVQGPLATRHYIEDAVKNGLRVRLASSGLTGPPYIEVVYLGPKVTSPPELPWTPAEIFVPSAPNTMSAIVADIKEIADQLKDAGLGKAVGDARKLMNDADKAINDVQMARVREKVVSAIDEVRASNKRLKEILDSPSIDQTVGDLPKITSRVRDTVDRLNAIMHDPKVDALLSNANTTLSGSSAAVADLRRSLRRLDSLLSSETEDLASIIVNLRRIMENGASLMGDVKDNPSRAIFGEPPPHFQPGAKK